MQIRGMMDGWTPDDMDCRGNCKICDDCEKSKEYKDNEDYERWRYEQSN